MSRVLITGATGFIGSHLTRFLSELGHEIVTLSHRPKSPGSFAWNPQVSPPPLKALEGVGAVIHLAGEPIAKRRWSDEVKKQIYDSRVVGTRHLMQGIQQMQGSKPSVVISASAIGYYGDRGEEVLTEVSKPGTDFLAQVCRDWEAEFFGAELPGVRRVASRTGLVIGKDGGAMEKLLPLFRKGLGGPLSTGEQWMSWIHISDLIQLFHKILTTQTLSGPVNAVTPNPVTNQEFTRTFARVLKRPAVFRVPRFALRMAVGEVADALLSSQRVIPQKISEQGQGFQFVFPHLEEALVEVSYY